MSKIREAVYLGTIMLLMGMCMRLSQPQEMVLVFASYTFSVLTYMLAVYYFYKEFLSGTTLTLFRKTIRF